MGNHLTGPYIKLHFAVLLFGFTAILGDLIHLPAMVLVFWRMVLTVLSLFFLVNVVRNFRKTSWRILASWMGVGTIVAMHWVAFFASIKMANASVGVVCIATTALFTSFLEPLLTGQRLKGYEVFLSLPVILGMVLVMEGLDLSMIGGVWVGLLSALLLALFGVLNKKLVHHGSSLFITLVELGTGGFVIGLLLLLFPFEVDLFWPSNTDWIYLSILALVCTTLGYVLALGALRHVTAFTSMMALNLEPVYGILLAHFLLKDGEDLSFSFYAGMLLILATIFIHPILRRRYTKALQDA